MCISEHRTRVIDDESDWFGTNKWLAPKQRDLIRAKEEELRDKRFGSKRGVQVTLDFAGRAETIPVFYLSYLFFFSLF